MSSKNNQLKATNQPIVVGIGASAGGLSAFESFFDALPFDEDSKIAFVLIQHLSPEYKSILPEIIQRYTKMKVFEAQNDMKIESNCVYIIPAKNDIAIVHSTIKLIKPTSPRGQRLPIDYFFNSLALEQHRYAVGIILSGTAHDGSKGIEAIKKHGGMVMAQTPDSCEFRGMPESAIATGFVDYILTPDEIAKQLLLHLKYFNAKTLLASDPIPKDENLLNKIFALLKKRTTHDFSMYKSSTIGRRIEKRMAVHQIESLDEYYKYLQFKEEELDELFSDFLIGVTNFFRDNDAFTILEENVVPKLLSRPSDTPIRIWVTGCSTGEEAYSLGIILMEYMEKTKQHFSIQIFATDIDPAAIAIARVGVYPLKIEENVSKERLERYFVKTSDNESYKIHKKIRDMLIFSIHDVIKDPPFSNLNMISCRNLLIYMTADLQQKLIFSFHYALKNDGFLFLGASETVGEFGGLFQLIDQKSKIYRCQKNITNTKQMIQHISSPVDNGITYHQFIPKVEFKTELSLEELTQMTILKQIAPSSVLVNEQGDILYLHGRSGIYLELPSGETNTNNILNMAREGLKEDLTLCLYKSKTTGEVVRVENLQIKNNDQLFFIDLTICPVKIPVETKSKAPLFVVMFQDKKDQERSLSINSLLLDNSNETQKIKILKEELELQKEFLQDMHNKFKLSNEELKSYNEEIQSMNEELQSTNEELETSKEELQSVNEELSTVNSELNVKVTDLSRINNDMNNLLAGTGIGTIFVDCKLSILRFTPAVTNIINLILTDLGRPIVHIASNIVGYHSMVADIKNVLDTLIPKEIEVQTTDMKWYLMRIQPYRTLENVIEGAVISFVNITDIVSMRVELKNAHALSRLAVIIRDSNDAITTQDIYGKITAWNLGAQKMYGWSEEEALNMSANDRIPQELQEEDEKRLIQLSKAEILESYKTKRLKKDGAIINVAVTSTALIDSVSGKVYAITTIERPFLNTLNKTES